MENNNNNNNVKGSPEEKSPGPKQIHDGDSPPMTPPHNATSEIAVSTTTRTYEIDIRTFSDVNHQDKKRGRGDGKSKSSHGEPKVVRKKGELTDVPKGEPKCATCKKTFKSWKALFGHLRSHPERSYRGALPPPTAMELDLKRRSVEGHKEEHLVSTLLSAAQKVVARFSREKRASSSPSIRGLNIDLNQQPTMEEGSSSRSNKARLDIDLNLLPAAESDEEEDQD